MWWALLTWAVALAAGTLGGIVVVVAILRAADSGTRRHRRPADPSDPGRPPDPAQVLRGGTWIGILERVGTIVAIIAGYPAAIAVIVAVKGLGRYPELTHSSGASERFIIGSLASLVWAGVIGLIARAVLANLVG